MLDDRVSRGIMLLQRACFAALDLDKAGNTKYAVDSGFEVIGGLPDVVPLNDREIDGSPP